MEFNYRQFSEFFNSFFIFLFFLYCLPLFFIYLILCFTLSFLKIGEIKNGKGLKLYVVRDAIHSDYVFEASLWSDTFNPKGKYIKIGWGDRKIFLETKKWSELKIIDFLTAFFGLNKTVLRVEFLDEMPHNSKSFDIDERQLNVIKIHIKDSHFGERIKKELNHYQNGDYYQSRLRYNCITNCNNWVNRGLYLSGITNRIWCPISFLI